MDTDTRFKISQSLRGKKKTAAHKKAISYAMRGMRKSKEHKKALSESLKEYFNNKRLRCNQYEKK